MLRIGYKVFTQLTNLNVTDELRVRGLLFDTQTIPDNINDDYDITINDDVVVMTADDVPLDANLPPSSDARKVVVIKSHPDSTQNITLNPSGSETVEGLSSQTLTSGQSLSLVPIDSGWLII